MSRVNRVKFGGSERLDVHHKAIIDFIKNNPECTENQVVKAMDTEPKVCSKMTTLRKLRELIEKQEISDLLKAGESHFHRFIINEHNEFNKIYASLVEIESVIDKVGSIRDKVGEASHSVDVKTTEHREVMDVIWFNINFSKSYQHGLDQMLFALMERTSKKIQSEKDSQILHNKIIRIIRKLYSQFPTVPMKEVLDKTIDNLEKANSSPLVEKLEIDANLIDDVKQVMENFKTQFLIDAKQEVRRTT